MKKDLPNVFANPLDKNISNFQEVYYSEKKQEDRSVSVDSILTKINKIFASTHHVYKSRVKITTNNGILEKDVVGKNSGSLLTIDGESVRIMDILDIEKI